MCFYIKLPCIHMFKSFQIILLCSLYYLLLYTQKAYFLTNNLCANCFRNVCVYYNFMNLNWVIVGTYPTAYNPSSYTYKKILLTVQRYTDIGSFSPTELKITKFSKVSFEELVRKIIKNQEKLNFK